MSIKHTTQLRSALANAPRNPSEYPIYFIGGNTRNALMALVDAIELVHRELANTSPDIDRALAGLDDFIA